MTSMDCLLGSRLAMLVEDGGMVLDLCICVGRTMDFVASIGEKGFDDLFGIFGTGDVVEG